MGILYIVPTPVGNMEDMTLRAIRILKEADVVLAEDTRTSGILLKHFEIKQHLMSHHKFNEHGTSDAGTPGISDPGFFLVREAVKAGIEVQTLPGATAFVPALVSSGLPCDRFCFEGFLPQKKGRQTKLQSLVDESPTFCTTSVMVPCLVSASAIVSGMRSPFSPILMMTKFPAFRDWAIRGASTTILNTFSEYCSLLTILFILLINWLS